MSENQLEFEIGELLRQRGLRLAVAESCTGGLVGHRVTNVPGSSNYFMGGIISYANEAKERLLYVRPETLERYGAVSAETVREMARGVRQALQAEIGMAISGIAGPGGGTADKPVGLVWIGLSAPSTEQTRRFVFAGERIEVKSQAAEAALQLVADYLRGVRTHPLR